MEGQDWNHNNKIERKPTGTKSKFKRITDKLIKANCFLQLAKNSTATITETDTTPTKEVTKRLFILERIDTLNY
ncbi:unnamed protein product [Moneuplotes crassus]|uniref:Uncharacterized protein n=1 Tax=Euplotes crassus TaxID=5936 RepID=A0AAD1UIW5_EUPCR|nr:unnamed protein product [Moneuplotes crassus]